MITMNMFCLMLLGGLVLGLASCANQGPPVAYDVPVEGPRPQPRATVGRVMRNQLRGSRQSNSPVRAAAELARLLFRFRQQTDELIFPQRRDGVAAVTTGFLTQGNYQRATMWNAFDFAFENSELGWC